MATSTREGRRRKILERGSDRLAFITGHLQNLLPHSHNQIYTNRTSQFKLPRTIGEENKAASTDNYNWGEQLSNTLEVGLVAKKVIDAVFMDYSVYAIIVMWAFLQIAIQQAYFF